MTPNQKFDADMESRLYFGNTREPFLMTLAGQKIYVVTSAKDVAAVYKNTVSLSFDTFIADMMRVFDVSPSALEKTWERPAPAGPGQVLLTANPQNKSLNVLSYEFHKHQLHPGEEMNNLRARFLPFLNEALLWENISGACVLRDSGKYKEISLLTWCRDILLDVATQAYFEDVLREIEPDFYSILTEFDNNVWMILYQYPRLLSQRMRAPKKRIHRTLTAYFKLPPEKRQGAAWFIRTFEAESRHLDVKEEDIAALMLMILLG